MSQEQIVGLMTGLSAVVSAGLWLARVYLSPHTYLWLSELGSDAAPA